MENKKATASLLFGATVLIVLWIAGSAILFFNEDLVKYGTFDVSAMSPIPLTTQIGYCIVLSLLAVVLSCALAEPCREYYIRTFGILGVCSLFVFLSMNAGLGIVW